MFPRSGAASGLRTTTGDHTAISVPAGTTSDGLPESRSLGEGTRGEAGGLAAVDDELRARREARLVAREIHDEVRHLLGHTDTTERDQSQARAWANQVLSIAQGEATAFDKVYEQYKLAPEVTRRRLYYETMERVLRNNDKVVVESNGVTPYLPLQEIRRKAVPVESPPAATVTGGQ